MVGDGQREPREATVSALEKEDLGVLHRVGNGSQNGSVKRPKVDYPAFIECL